jgi:hypothetical protein
MHSVQGPSLDEPDLCRRGSQTEIIVSSSLLGASHVARRIVGLSDGLPARTLLKECAHQSTLSDTGGAAASLVWGGGLGGHRPVASNLPKRPVPSPATGS